MLAEGDVPDSRAPQGAVGSGDVQHDDELVRLFVGVLWVLLGRRLAVAEVLFPRGDLADGLFLEGDEAGVVEDFKDQRSSRFDARAGSSGMRRNARSSEALPYKVCLLERFQNSEEPRASTLS